MVLDGFGICLYDFWMVFGYVWMISGYLIFQDMFGCVSMVLDGFGVFFYVLDKAKMFDSSGR